MTALTDADRAEIEAAVHEFWDMPIPRTPSGLNERIYLAGKRAARLETIEECAREIERRFGVCPESGAIRGLLNRALAKSEEK